jgi:hypothetical protein
MPEIESVDLRGKIPDAGPVHFLRAEWKVPRSRFVILRFALDDREQDLGLRLGLDIRPQSALKEWVFEWVPSDCVLPIH